MYLVLVCVQYPQPNAVLANNRAIQGQASTSSQAPQGSNITSTNEPFIPSQSSVAPAQQLKPIRAPKLIVKSREKRQV